MPEQKELTVNQYTVGLVGCGPRGRTHLDAFLAYPDRYRVVGVCDLDAAKARLLAESTKTGPTYTDAAKMMAETKPEILCFATPPAVRSKLIELGIEHNVKGIAFEKPLALTVREARRIHAMCSDAGVKAVVSHQMKYLTSMQHVHRITRSGDIGQVREIHATTVPWMHQLGTHYMDLICWLAEWSRPRWAIGHVHGRDKLTDSHASPDYIFGQVAFENGIRAILECGYLAPHNISDEFSWVDNRVTVYGSHGYVWGETDGRWGVLSKSHPEPSVEQGESWQEQSEHSLQRSYVKELADWLDDDSAEHICSLDHAMAGLEALHGIAFSALENIRVDFPFDPKGKEVIEEMTRCLP
jgi:predicted dehydrogenase